MYLEFSKAVFAKSLQVSVEADPVGNFLKMHLKVRICIESLEVSFSEGLL